MHDRAVASLFDPSGDVEMLDAMAKLARDTGLVVHVVSPRQPGFLSHARAVAEQGGVRVDADVMPHTLRVRFSR